MTVSFLFKFLVSKWRILETTNYSAEGCPSSWHIYGKMFGMFWMEMFKNMNFVSPYSFCEVNFGYDSPEKALEKLSKKIGAGQISRKNVEIRRDEFIPRRENMEVLRFNVVKSRKSGNDDRFSVAEGFYVPSSRKETFVIIGYEVEDCLSPEEAVMKASLKGISVDNPNRFK